MKVILTGDFDGGRLAARLAPRRPRVTLAFERSAPEVLVHHVLGDGRRHLLHLHAGVRIDVRLQRRRGQRLRAAAAFERELRTEQSWLVGWMVGWVCG